MASGLAEELEVGQGVLFAALIEGRERLVEQQQTGLREQGAAQRHPLPLAAGQRGGCAFEQGFEIQPAHHLLEAQPPLRERHAPITVFQIAAHPQMGKQPAVLKHHAHPTLMRCDEDPARGILPAVFA